MRNDYCVYTHINPSNGQVFYVGMGSIKRSKEFNSGRNKNYKAFVKKIGIPNVSIIGKDLNLDNAINLEKFLIKYFGLNNLTNISPGGDGILGFSHSEESRRKMSETRKGRKLSEEHKEKLRQALIGRKRPPEVIAKVAASNTGKKRSGASKDNMRNAQLGKTLSEEHKNNIGKSIKGMKRSDEFKAKLSENKRDKTLYHFFHDKHGRKFCTQLELRKEFNLESSAISAMIKGKRNMHGGWKISLHQPMLQENQLPCGRGNGT